MTNIPSKYFKYAFILLTCCSIRTEAAGATDALEGYPAGCTRGHVATSHGDIAFVESNAANPNTVVFIHGNSASGAAFTHQLEALSAKYRVIAFDLPGHGASGNSIKPMTEVEVPGHGEGAAPMKAKLTETYSYPGYGAAMIEALEKLGISNALVCGWSLGGHAAFEMLAQNPDLVAGLIVTGAPPIPLTEDGFGKGFKFSLPPEGKKGAMDMIGQGTQFIPEDAEHFLVLGGFKAGPDLKVLVDAGVRTHGLARECMFNAVMGGQGVDASAVIAARDKAKTQVAFVGGKDDGGVNNEYIAAYAAANGCEYFEVPGAHACFYTDPAPFNAALEAFAAKVFKA